MVNPCDKRLERAQQILTELGSDKPAQRGIVAHLAARWALSLGDTSRADELFRMALDALPALRPAIRGIQRVILQGGEKKKVLEWLDLQIRATSHPREAAALYRERGRLIEQIFGDIKATRQCHEAAILAAPDDLSVLFSLFHIHEHSGNLEATGQALQKIADNIDDDGYRAVLEHANALLSLTIDAPADEILQRLSWAVRYSPGNPIIAHDAFRIAQQLGTPADALTFLMDEHQLRKAQGAQGPALWRMAQILNAQEHRSDALALLSQAARAHPQRLHLWDQLLDASIHEKDHDQAARAAIARVKILQSAEAPWQATAWYELADQLLARDRHDIHALNCLEQAIKLDPSHKGAGYRYLEVLRDQERYEDLVEQAEAWCEQPNAGAHPKERATWLEEAASICFRYLNDPNRGHALLKSALAFDRSNTSVRAALERVYFDEDDAAALRNLYRQDLEHTEDPDRELLLRTLLCHVVPEIQDNARAIQDNRALLALKPDCIATTQQLARLVSTTGDDQALLEITLQESQLDIPLRKKATLVAQAGDLSLRLQDVSGALVYYKKALELDPLQDGARRSLEAMARQSNDRPALLEHLQRQLDQYPDSAGLRLEIADLLLESGPSANDALAVLTPLVDGPASSFCALRSGEKILRSLGDPRRALDFIDRRVGMLEGPRARAFWLLRSAWIRWRHINDQSSALEDLWRASTLAPELHVTHWLLFELLAHQGSTRVWPWLRQQLQRREHGPSMEPLVTRWLIRNPPTREIVEWLSLDSSRRADGPSQCLNWLDPARRHQAHRLQAKILDRYLQDRPARPQDPRRMMLRYLSARAHALCRNWDAAIGLCDELSAWELGHQEIEGGIVARTTYLVEHQTSALNSMVGRLKHQRTEQRSRAVRLHSSLWIIDLLAQAGHWNEACKRCLQLIATTPKYLPAHYLYIYCLENQPEAPDLARIASAYLALAQ